MSIISVFETVKLGDYINTEKGYAFKSGWYTKEGVPLVKVSNFTDNSVDTSNLVCIPQDIAEKYKKHELKTNDIIIQTVGSWPSNPQSVVGKVIRIPATAARALLNQNAVKINPDSSLHQPFLYYLLKSSTFKEYIISCAQGAASQASITLDAIREFRFKCPPLPTQRKIAAILSAYDDLIENNMRRIEILEEMARSLYREWFVNFRFPGHEQVKMVDSELGLIPEGWEVKKLDELGSIGRGKSKHRPRNDPSLYGGDYPFVQTGEVKEALLYITHYTQTYNEKGLAQSKLWEPKTLLLTIAANIAETAILTIPACFPDSIVGFVADSEQVTPEFIKFRIDDIKEKMQSFSRGTAQDNLSLDKIKVFDFLVPGKDCIQLFDKYTAPLFSQVQNLLLKNANLRHTRDLLLPKLISGEIDVENFHNNTKELAA